ncbi:MBL fold metallo-hydrolase [Spiroplasma endosymbiont of Anurida maritima]|uniref:MBL fold metallo-hydrolase n=1 Tax=Spiroplasma endosymbiont of Anurida maritima TaxID=2967972 RepID=UPI0036D25E70
MTSFNTNNVFTNFVKFYKTGVGQTTLIKDQSLFYFVDAGTENKSYNKITKNILLQDFAKYNITKIEAIFISHPHYDHNSLVKFISKTLKVNKVIVNIKPNKFFTLNNFKFMRFINNTKDVNNDSIIIQFKNNLLFLGDINLNIYENQILSHFITGNNIVVSHHGSLASFSLNFYKKFSPKKCIISSRKKNYLKNTTLQSFARVAKFILWSCYD